MFVLIPKILSVRCELENMLHEMQSSSVYHRRPNGCLSIYFEKGCFLVGVGMELLPFDKKISLPITMGFYNQLGQWTPLPLWWDPWQIVTKRSTDPRAQTIRIVLQQGWEISCRQVKCPVLVLYMTWKKFLLDLVYRS